jgi:hypothetical protein
MASDDTEALDQVAEAVDRSDLTDEDVEELRALLEKLDDEEWADQKRHRVGTVSVTAPSRRFDGRIHRLHGRLGLRVTRNTSQSDLARFDDHDPSLNS